MKKYLLLSMCVGLFAMLLSGCGGGGGGSGVAVQVPGEADTAALKALIGRFAAAIQSSDTTTAGSCCSSSVAANGTLGTIALRDLAGNQWSLIIPSDGITYLSESLASLKAYIENVEGYRFDFTFHLQKISETWLIEDIELSTTAIDFPAPTISAMQPNSGVNNATLNNVVITGTGFQSGATVRLTRTDQTDVTAVVSNVAADGTTLTCSIPLSGKQPGTWNVVITNPDNKSVNAANLFTITAAGPSPAPIVSDVTPGSGTNDASVNVSVIGANFVNGARVRLTLGQLVINAQSVIVAANGESLTCTLPLAQQETGEWTFTVINPDNQSADWSRPFIVELPCPEITGVNPEIVPNNQSVNMTITGLRFKNGATVAINNGNETIEATDVTVDSATQIRCVLPMTGAQPGEWSLTVTNPDDFKSAFSFQVALAPTITAVTPTTSNLTVLGTNIFDGATLEYRKSDTDVWRECTFVEVTNNENGSQIYGLAELDSGSYSVRVTNLNGTSVTGTFDFIVVPE